MIVGTGDWDDLEDATVPGTVRRRLFPDSSHDLFLAVRHPEQSRMLTLGLDAVTARVLVRRVSSVPSTQGMELTFVSTSGGARELQLALSDAGLADVFNVLVGDVATETATAAAGIRGAEAFVERFERWIRLLRSLNANGMSDERRRGLAGELMMLVRLLAAEVPQGDVVAAWTGPDEAHQDFQFPDLAIEVKTSAARQPRTMVISSERQLDETGCGCLLLGHVLLDERRGGTGASLNDLVRQVAVELTSTSTRSRFEELVVRSGLLPHQIHLYDEPRYTLRAETVWRVADDFPRITEADLRPGVGGCTYRVGTTGLERHVVESSEFDLLVRGAGSV